LLIIENMCVGELAIFVHVHFNQFPVLHVLRVNFIENTKVKVTLVVQVALIELILQT
jgi:hypothetical protein